MLTFLSDVLQEALALGPIFWGWLKALTSPQAVIWYVLGLLTLPLIGRISVRFGFWRMKVQLSRKVEGQPGSHASLAMRILSKACPNAPRQFPRNDRENILSVMANVVEIVERDTTTDWHKFWDDVDSSWLHHLVSKWRMIQETAMQEVMARAFVYGVTTPSSFDHRDTDILASISAKDWETFTTVCGFACSIGGRITPVIFNYDDDAYREAGLNAEAIDSLIATGLVTRGGTGDAYTLAVPSEGFCVIYFDEEEFVVKPLPTPIPRNYFGRTRIQSHPLDKNLNVGVVDFTESGRKFGFLTSCSKKKMDLLRISGANGKNIFTTRETQSTLKFVKFQRK